MTDIQARLFQPGSRIRLRPCADGTEPYIEPSVTVADLAVLNGVGEGYVRKVIDWLREEMAVHFREGEHYALSPDGIRITEHGQVPIAKVTDTNWAWEVWKEFVKVGLHARKCPR